MSKYYSKTIAENGLSLPSPSDYGEKSVSSAIVLPTFTDFQFLMIHGSFLTVRRSRAFGGFIKIENDNGEQKSANIKEEIFLSDGYTLK
ncbi:hypothetical protein [Victivallis sp. Marseille-Q1083]|uniref:hypothetical protein n=1 Tax=Victivallis sp. Marseille-Q1083 TaxID=2717288 RepID=UPI00158A8FF6|nr:hypothetical protein [Victivallis sp. Marseille-Q1083]